MSPTVSIGSRVLARIIAISVSLTLPSSSELQERDVESLHEHVGAVRAEADAADVHHVARCRRTAPTSLPLWKQGVVMTKSFRWPVPFHGSLVM